MKAIYIALMFNYLLFHENVNILKISNQSHIFFSDYYNQLTEEETRDFKKDKPWYHELPTKAFGP